MWKLLFLEPVNLICLAIVGMAAFLTLDGPLALWGLTFEGSYLVGAYLLLAWKTKWAQKLHDKRSGCDRVTVRLNVALLVVLIFGAIIIGFAGFLRHLLSNPLPELTNSQRWEASAVIWTILFLVYYFCKWKMTANQKSVIVLLGFALVSLIAALLLVYPLHFAGPRPYLSSEYLHVVLIALGTLFMLLVDWVLWRKGDNEKEKIRSRQSFLVADVPVFVAFVVLLACLFQNKDKEHVDAFFGGAVSFQLVVSNILFIVTEFNLLAPVTMDQSNPTSAATIDGRAATKGSAANTETRT